MSSGKKQYRIAVIPGDGIGKEVMPEGVRALDAAARKIDLLVEDAELARRRAQWKPPEKPARGYGRLYVERVTQADKGCDFDFLAG